MALASIQFIIFMICLKLWVAFSLLLLTLEVTYGQSVGQNRTTLREYKIITLKNYRFFQEGNVELQKIKSSAEEGQVNTSIIFANTMRRLKQLFLRNRTLRHQWNRAKLALLESSSGFDESALMVDKDTDILENLFDAYIEEYKVTSDEVKSSFHQELTNLYPWDKRIPI
ncbi:hypothetical protein K7432_000137 [Basidiobolus ranarum]|uniref:Uncharacterized protein n=1 Tax=Basidiobolus ranarum TaxID=34480 RepID=A0ABR2WBM7_9FUNG